MDDLKELVDNMEKGIIDTSVGDKKHIDNLKYNAGRAINNIDNTTFLWRLITDALSEELHTEIADNSVNKTMPDKRLEQLAKHNIDSIIHLGSHLQKSLCKDIHDSNIRAIETLVIALLQALKYTR